MDDNNFELDKKRRHLESVETEVNEVLGNFRAIHGDKVGSIVSGLVRAAAYMENNLTLIAAFGTDKMPEDDMLALLRSIEMNGKAVLTLLVQPSITEWPESLRAEVNKVIEVALNILQKLRHEV